MGEVGRFSRATSGENGSGGRFDMADASRFEQCFAQGAPNCSILLFYAIPDGKPQRSFPGIA
jgi:hypothetical protein